MTPHLARHYAAPPPRWPWLGLTLALLLAAGVLAIVAMRDVRPDVVEVCP